MHMNEPQEGQTEACGGFGGMFKLGFPVSFLFLINRFAFSGLGLSVEW